jgi:CBS domain-containing protein
MGNERFIQLNRLYIQRISYAYFEELLMKVREVMTKSLAFIGAGDTIQEAARKMKTLNIRNLPVVIGNEAVGVVTDRDIVVRTVAQGLDPRETKVADAMTKGIVVCKEGDELGIAAKMMGSRHLRGLPVINRNGELTGSVSLTDITDRINPSVTVENLKTILP